MRRTHDVASFHSRLLWPAVVAVAAMLTSCTASTPRPHPTERQPTTPGTTTSVTQSTSAPLSSTALSGSPARTVGVAHPVDPYQRLGVGRSALNAISLDLRPVSHRVVIALDEAAARAALARQFPSGAGAPVPERGFLVRMRDERVTTQFAVCWAFVIHAVVGHTFGTVPGRTPSFTVIFIDALTGGAPGGFVA